MEKEKKKRSFGKIILGVLFGIIIIGAVCIFLYRSGIYRFDFAKYLYRKIDFVMNSDELSIPQDALSFSIYDMKNDEYLYYEGDHQRPTVASLSKLYSIDYALTKVDLDEMVVVPQDVLDIVPSGSSLADLIPGEYTVWQLMEGMLVPSGNDAAYALAYHVAQKELGDGYTAQEYVDYYVQQLNGYLAEEGYTKTSLYDPSGFSVPADTNLQDINRVALKLLEQDFIRDCIAQSTLTIETPQGEFTWKNSNEFLDPSSPYYNKQIKGMKTGTMSSSYNIIALYEDNDREYLITCLAARSNEGRYEAVQAAINTLLP